MNNPRLILSVLDRRLQRETRIIVYGRAAIALGFADAAPEVGATLDVDALLPAVEMAAIEADGQFWQALDATNRELESQGLYMTHLFPDDQVILSPDWLTRIVGLPLRDFRRLQVFRPSTVDLILTKMMRQDPQDLADIAFLLRHEPMGTEALREAFARARVPDLEEIRAAFIANHARVLALAVSGSRQ
jgi:hypothetical protein